MKEAREKATMASRSRRFLTFVEMDTAVEAMNLEFRNIKFCWDLLLQQVSGAADSISQFLPRSSSSSSSLP